MKYESQEIHKSTHISWNSELPCAHKPGTPWNNASRLTAGTLCGPTFRSGMPHSTLAMWIASKSVGKTSARWPLWSYQTLTKSGCYRAILTCVNVLDAKGHQKIARTGCVQGNVTARRWKFHQYSAALKQKLHLSSRQQHRAHSSLRQIWGSEQQLDNPLTT